jgi:hypothetical protein
MFNKEVPTMLRKELAVSIAAALLLGACANSPLHERTTVAKQTQSGAYGTGAATPSSGGDSGSSASGSSASGSASSSGTK